MIILDTDHFNILQIGKGTPYDALAALMDASPDQHFATTVITFEEHMRGWLAGIRRAREVVSQIRPYDQLINHSSKKEPQRGLNSARSHASRMP